MGTNYFCITNDMKKRHIGKQSYGWSFLFHGYIENDFSIRSYADWRKMLLQKEVRIEDDCGEEVQKSDFFTMLEESLICRKFSVLDNSESWLDETKFAFLNRYFS